MNRTNPFGLIIILNSNGNAQGDLFSDDGESIDTIERKSYYYSTFQWSSSNQQLTMNIIQNNYSNMSHLILDTIAIYGLKHIPTIINVNNKHVYAKVRPYTEIVDIIDIGLPMNKSYTFTWSNTTSMNIESPKILSTNPKYRVDCFPDPGY